MQRIYYKELKKNVRILVVKDKEIMHQLLKVLRSKLGDYVAFFNGVDDIEYVYTIEKIDKKEITFVIFDSFENNNEIDFNLNLYQALPNKLEKIEYILQKGVEIGITNFYFWKSERSQKLLISENKKERLEKIIIEAVEQSERNKIPKLEFLEKLDFGNLRESENIFCHPSPPTPSPNGRGGEKQLPNNIKIKNLKLDFKKSVNLFIGPEGGFSDKEVSEFEKNNFKKIYLGDRILRTETVGIVTGFYIVQSR